MEEKIFIDPRLRELIEKKFGEPILYSYQCAALEEDISNITGKHLGLTTIKRLYGMTGDSHFPRTSTLDILARYVGYESYALLLDDSVISTFTSVESIDSEKLEPHDIVTLAYNPGRRLTLEFIGGGQFIVRQSTGSKLHENDLLKISQLALGFELLVSGVERDGRDLGSYIGARQGGLTELYQSQRK